LTYRQEYYKGEAEDAAEVLSTDELVSRGALRVLQERAHDQGLHALEPRLLEHKFYARGVGLVLALEISGGAKRVELLRFERSA
jgi:hypothetical protein